MHNLILTFIILSLFSTPLSADDSNYFSYNEFIDMVEKDQIISVEVDRLSLIHGVYVKDGKKQKFSTYSDTGSSNDPLLIGLLKKHDISVAIKPQMEPDTSFPVFYSVISILLPIATFIFIIILNIKLNKIIKNLNQS